MHNQVRPSNFCSNSFSHCKDDQKKKLAISQMFIHVQLYVHWMHLLNIVSWPALFPLMFGVQYLN